MHTLEKISPIQQKAIALLAEGSNLTDTAKQLEISRKTLSGWLNGNEDFQAALKDAQAEIFSEQVRHIKSKTKRAIEVLSDALESENLRVRLSAASKLLTIVGLQTSIAESEKPVPIIFPPAIHSELCPSCGEKSFNAFLAEMD